MNKGLGRDGGMDNCVVLPENRRDQGRDSMEACLIGKLWIDKSFNVRAFTNISKGVWSPRKSVEINELGKNLFIS